MARSDLHEQIRRPLDHVEAVTTDLDNGIGAVPVGNDTCPERFTHQHVCAHDQRDRALGSL